MSLAAGHPLKSCWMASSNWTQNGRGFRRTHFRCPKVYNRQLRITTK